MKATTYSIYFKSETQSVAQRSLCLSFLFCCYSFIVALFTRFLLLYYIVAKLITDDQPEAVKKQRVVEIQQRKEIYKWGDDPNFMGLPGFIKSESVKTLPKDIRFTEEAIDDLYTAKRKALVNLGMVKLLNMFDSWEDFNDYKKVISRYS